jgi:hypothetical protein
MTTTAPIGTSSSSNAFCACINACRMKYSSFIETKIIFYEANTCCCYEALFATLRLSSVILIIKVQTVFTGFKGALQQSIFFNHSDTKGTEGHGGRSL